MLHGFLPFNSPRFTISFKKYYHAAYAYVYTRLLASYHSSRFGFVAYTSLLVFGLCDGLMWLNRQTITTSTTCPAAPYGTVSLYQFGTIGGSYDNPVLASQPTSSLLAGLKHAVCQAYVSQTWTIITLVIGATPALLVAIGMSLDALKDAFIAQRTALAFHSGKPRRPQPRPDSWQFIRRNNFVASCYDTALIVSLYLALYMAATWLFSPAFTAFQWLGDNFDNILHDVILNL